MKAIDMEEYWKSITIIEAQEALVRFQAMDFPNMKKDERKRLHKEIHKKAYPDTYKNRKQISTVDFAKMFGQG